MENASRGPGAPPPRRPDATDASSRPSSSRSRARARLGSDDPDAPSRARRGATKVSRRRHSSPAQNPSGSPPGGSPAGTFAPPSCSGRSNAVSGNASTVMKPNPSPGDETGAARDARREGPSNAGGARSTSSKTSPARTRIARPSTARALTSALRSGATVPSNKTRAAPAPASFRAPPSAARTTTRSVPTGLTFVTMTRASTSPESKTTVQGSAASTRLASEADAERPERPERLERPEERPEERPSASESELPSSSERPSSPSSPPAFASSRSRRRSSRFTHPRGVSSAVTCTARRGWSVRRLTKHAAGPARDRYAARPSSAALSNGANRERPARGRRGRREARARSAPGRARFGARGVREGRAAKRRVAP